MIEIVILEPEHYQWIYEATETLVPGGISAVIQRSPGSSWTPNAWREYCDRNLLWLVVYKGDPWGWFITEFLHETPLAHCGDACIHRCRLSVEGNVRVWLHAHTELMTQNPGLKLCGFISADMDPRIKRLARMAGVTIFEV